jgi:hypothetical protein
VTGGLLLVGAGLKQFGTEAAGRLLADPDQLGMILRKLPRGWEAKNMQIVLHTQVIGKYARSAGSRGLARLVGVRGSGAW